MSGRFLFLSPNTRTPAGGVQKIYEFAGALVRANYDALVVHNSPGFVPWFDHAVTVTHRGAIRAAHDDVVVVPELQTRLLPMIAPGVTKLILNQSIHVVQSPGHFGSPDVASIVVVSEHLRRFCEIAYSPKPIQHIRLGVDTEMFTPGVKRKRIAYMPRKRPAEAQLILHVLRNRGLLEGWEIIAIERLSRQDVAAVLASADVFLSFSEREGFGLPPLEAMAAGCLVVGYHGTGGEEFFDNAWCLPVPENDTVSFVLTAKAVLSSFDQGRYRALQQAAAAMVRQRYTLSRQDEDAVSIFGDALEVAALCPPAKPAPLGPSGVPGRYRASAYHLARAWKVLRDGN